MRHIPKLAVIVGAMGIGVLGFQGVASAGTQGGKPVETSYWWYNPQTYCPPYPGHIKPPPTPPVVKPPPTYPVVFHFSPLCWFFPVVFHGQGQQHNSGGGYQLTSFHH